MSFYRAWPLYLLLVIFSACESRQVHTIKPSDLTGTWQIQELPPRLLRQPEVAASYLRFYITLMPDGAMMAKNVPAGVFFDWPAADEYAGTWQIDPRSTGETTYLDFNLRGPNGKSGTYGTYLDWKGGKRSIYLSIDGGPMHAVRN